MEILNENNYEEIINGYSKSTWNPLFELIAKIEESISFGELKIKEDSIFPRYNLSSVVNEFINLVYGIPIMISFDWKNWEEGSEIFKNKNFDYNSIDIPTKCKLLSSIVRSDRFNEGILVISFEDGTILKILKSIQNQFYQNSL